MLSLLPDALISHVLDTLVTSVAPRDAGATLCLFSEASTYAFAFAADEDLWRRIIFQLVTPAEIATAPYKISWRTTCLNLFSAKQESNQESNHGLRKFVVYSDVLFHKWRCLTTLISSAWLEHTDVSRISAEKASPEFFREHFDRRNIPVIITDVVKKWAAYSNWTREGLVNRCGDIHFNAGGCYFSLRHYFAYCEAVENKDDQPLYIFDKHFANKVPSLTEDYAVPEYFSDDLFNVLGENRPDYRWLIIGPARSGSSFHKDPNCTSAWNAVIKGRKKWVLFPPHVSPPGVFPSGDEGDVTAPISITEWFLNFYDRQQILALGGMECICEEGELMFVPMGWWHCVLNIETSIAITQNFVGECNVSHVARWVGNKRDHVSGCRTKDQATYISNNFATLVGKRFPHLKQMVDIESDAKQHQTDLTRLYNKKDRQSLWDRLNTVGESQVCVAAQPLSGALNQVRTERFTFGF